MASMPKNDFAHLWVLVLLLLVPLPAVVAVGGREDVAPVEDGPAAERVLLLVAVLVLDEDDPRGLPALGAVRPQNEKFGLSPS